MFNWFVLRNHRQVRLFSFSISADPTPVDVACQYCTVCPQCLLSESWRPTYFNFIYFERFFHTSLPLAGVGRRTESCRHNCLLLGALNGHFLIFTLQIFFFCRHMWRCGDHLPTSDLDIHSDVFPRLGNSYFAACKNDSLLAYRHDRLQCIAWKQYWWSLSPADVPLYKFTIRCVDRIVDSG